MESICREGRVIMRRQTRCLYLRDIQDMRVVDTFNYFFIEYQCKRETADNCMLLCSEVHACSMRGRAGGSRCFGVVSRPGSTFRHRSGL